MLEFKVEKQKLIRLDVEEPATDSEQYLKARFTINDPDWNGKARTAYFRLGDAVYKRVLNINNVCLVPSEVLVRSESRYARTHGSEFFVSLVGEYSTTRITTDEIQVCLNTSGYADAEEPAAPTESEYQQIITQYANNEAAINEARAECETARADLVGVKNIFANGIKGNLSGAVVHADDVSPVEHNPEVWVHGKNLAKRTNENKTETNSGITYTVLEDGRVSASGTATGTAYYIINNSTDWAYQIPIKKGIYTIPKAPIDGCRISVGIRENQNTERVLYYSTPTNTVTFEVTSNEARFDMILCVDTGKTVNGAIFEPQLEKGDTATEYEPYVAPETMTVRRCGKNIYKVTAKTQTTNGLTFTVNSDGSVIANGTAEKTTFFSLGTLNVIPDETYFLSGSPNGSAFDTYMLYIHNNTTGSDIYDLGQGNDFDGKSGDQGLVIVVYSGVTVNNLKFYPMVEYGSEGGNFEAYNGTDFTPSADGTVEGITSLSPNMTILTDTEGAIVECEYIKDTNKVVQKLADALGITI